MNRGRLLLLQILVAVACIAIWHIFSTYPICGLSRFGRENDCLTLLPPFFFSTPLDVGSRVVKWFVEGTIWKHLWITLVEAMLAEEEAASVVDPEALADAAAVETSRGDGDGGQAGDAGADSGSGHGHS